MADVTRYRPDDRRAVEALYRRVFGNDAAESSRLRWEWQYRRNPNNPGGEPEIWIAREGTALVGQYATMPVKLSVKGDEIKGSWGMDVMVAPERQRQGLGEVLFRTWDRNVGASLGLGLSDASYRLFQKLRWPDVGPIPCLVKPLSRRAFRHPRWPTAINRLISAVTFPVVLLVARSRPLRAEVRLVPRFDDSFTELWDALAPRFDVAVRRDAAYLNWKFATAPHVRYTMAALLRQGKVAGYAVYRHVHEPRGRVTLLVDFLTDPDDENGFTTLLRWVDREAREADSDKIRVFALHAAFRRLLKKSGYFQVKSTMEFVIKVNDAEVPHDFYENTDGWHVTLGDSDQDR
ncbi:MAG TPA: GNAT family N-acetyltransferase [Vicinamibacterales bacterium]|jgi:GNAT superfamily N-acetyltransferase|nr:GNAT family N-acetyltransferase [Vicinamibacterales bacterium]